MNIPKIKEALRDAQKSKKSAELNGYTGDYDFWDGYEAAIKFALLHLDQGEQNERRRRFTNGTFRNEQTSYQRNFGTGTREARWD